MAINTNLKSLTPRREAYKKEIVLVSGGYYAPKAFPEGKITVYPWDAVTDAWFQDRLRKPKRDNALWEVVERIANLNGVSYKEMPVGDALTVLMVSRSMLTDCVIEYVAVCPQCQRQHPDKVVVPNELVPVGKKAPDFNGLDAIVLPDSKDVVDLRVMTIGDEQKVSDRSDDEKAEVPDAIATVLFAIATIGGGRPDSKGEALLWFNALSPKDANYLRKMRAELTPQLDPDLKIKCDSCEHVFTHSLELHRDFFR